MSLLRRLFGSGKDGRSTQTTLELERLEPRVLLGGTTFGPEQVESTQADEAKSVYACDLDGDGDMDILSASYADDKIAWYENIGGESAFAGEQVITTQADGALSVYACDLDGDGDVDVLSASSHDDKVAWYENLDGAGSFGGQQVITTQASGAIDVYACDLDGDGDMDVLSASRYEEKIAWYENLDGAGSFGGQQLIATDADFPMSVYASDLDGDDDMDVLSASADDGEIAWYENLGDDSFGGQQVITTQASGIQWVYACDLDGDGDMDILGASKDDDKIAWYENLGGGAFGAEQIITTQADEASSVYASDLDGDGDLDVVSASSGDDKIAWYENLFAPWVAVHLRASSDSGVSDSDNITNDNTPTYDVSVNMAGTIEIDWEDDEAVDVTDVVAVAGTYQYTPDSALDEGVYPVSVTFTDAASGVATASDPTTIDRTAPDVPRRPNLKWGSDSGVAHRDDITNVDSPAFKVPCTDDFFRFYRDGVQISGDYESEGSYTTPGEPKGEWRYTVSCVDAAGNESKQSAGLAVEIDRTAPDVPRRPNLKWGSDSGVAHRDDITNVDSPAFKVPCTDDFFRFYRDGVQISGDYESEGSYTTPGEPKGEWRYTVSCVDAAGNESKQSAGLAVEIDRTAPGAPDAPDLLRGSDTGPSPIDNITSDRTPTLGLSGFGTYWRLERDGSQISGNYETARRFRDGPLAYDGYSYVLYAVDAAGNVSGGSDALDITVQFAVEQGTVSARHKWTTVTFSEDFVHPVVVAGPATNNDSSPGVVRVKRVTANSFKVRFREWKYLDGRHKSENIHWLAVERGTWDLGGGKQLVAGTLKTSNTNMKAPTRLRFNSAFGSTPVVIAQVQTCNDSDAVTDRISGVRASRFKVALQEEEAGGNHKRERVGYIALSQGVSEITGINCEVGSIARVTHSGSAVPGTAWDLWVSEEKSREPEIIHLAEVVGYISFGGRAALIADMQTVNEKDTANLRYE